MRSDLMRRIEALEVTRGEPTEIWIGPPERGLAGWECMAQNQHPPEKVWRHEGESDEDLAGRARACMKRMRLEGGWTSSVSVYCALDDRGMTR